MVLDEFKYIFKVWKKLCASEKVDLFDLALGLLGFSNGLAKAIFSATCGAFSP